MSKNIYGVHEYDDRWGNMVTQAGREAWVLLLTEISSNYSGIQWNKSGITPIVRINWGYGTTGTMPKKEFVPEFAKRCEHFARNSNINYYQLFNELSLQWEWPDGVMPTWDEYLDCHRKVADAIRRGNPNAKIAFAPPAPWNPTFYGDWVDLIPKLCNALGPNYIDWFSLHTYTKGYELEKFDVSVKMDAPYQHREFSFQVLYEQLNAIPQSYKSLPVVVTETNGDDSWSNNHTGRWVQTFYHEINEWNSNPSNQKILGGIIFRFNQGDSKWHIDDRSLEDFKQSLQWDYKHNFQGKPPVQIEPDLSPEIFATVTAEAGLNLRDAPVNGKILTVLVEHQTVQLHKVENGWANVSVPNTNYTGWVSSVYLK